MKFALRAFTMLVVITGLTAASAPAVDSPTIPNYLSMSMMGPGPLSLPSPGCGTTFPNCNQNPSAQQR